MSKDLKDVVIHISPITVPIFLRLSLFPHSGEVCIVLPMGDDLSEENGVEILFAPWVFRTLLDQLNHWRDKKSWVFTERFMPPNHVPQKLSKLLDDWSLVRFNPGTGELRLEVPLYLPDGPIMIMIFDLPFHVVSVLHDSLACIQSTFDREMEDMPPWHKRH